MIMSVTLMIIMIILITMIRIIIYTVAELGHFPLRTRQVKCLYIYIYVCKYT